MLFDLTDIWLSGEYTKDAVYYDWRMPVMSNTNDRPNVCMSTTHMFPVATHIFDHRRMSHSYQTAIDTVLAFAAIISMHMYNLNRPENMHGCNTGFDKQDFLDE